MFGAETAAKGLTFTKVLSGLNKTLSIANQVIPIYQQAKPMIQNAKSAFQLLKEFGNDSKSTSKNTQKTSTKPTTNEKRLQTKKASSSLPIVTQNSPVFFV